MNCDNSSCIHLQKESSLLEQELAATRLSISSLEKAMEQMRKDRDAALDEYAVANIKVHKNTVVVKVKFPQWRLMVKSLLSA